MKTKKQFNVRACVKSSKTKTNQIKNVLTKANAMNVNAQTHKSICKMRPFYFQISIFVLFVCCQAHAHIKKTHTHNLFLFLFPFFSFFLHSFLCLFCLILFFYSLFFKLVLLFDSNKYRIMCPLYFSMRFTHEIEYIMSFDATTFIIGQWTAVWSTFIHTNHVPPWIGCKSNIKKQKQNKQI